MNDHLSERELVRMTVATLHHLARACHNRYRAKAARERITEREYVYHRALTAYADSTTLVGASARLAWLELDQDCRNLVAERGQNPDLLLRWLDIYPKTVLTVILSPKTPENSVSAPITH